MALGDIRLLGRPAAEGFIRSRAYFLFLAILGIQGFHLLEHVLQVTQRYALGIANGNGIVGSVAEIEPVHLIYNTAYLALLFATYVSLGLHHGAAPFGGAVHRLLTFALGFQAFHVIEHEFKILQYIQLGFQNGTGGIFGIGPGGVFPLFPIPLLHLAYNALAYLPAVLAFFLLVRQPRFEPAAPR